MNCKLSSLKFDSMCFKYTSGRVVIASILIYEKLSLPVLTALSESYKNIKISSRDFLFDYYNFLSVFEETFFNSEQDPEND